VDLTVVIGSRARRVRVTEDRGRLLVSVDGRPTLVDARRASHQSLSLLVFGSPGPAGHAPVAARSYDVSVAPKGSGSFDVGVAGQHVPVVVRNGRWGDARATPGSSDPSMRIVAPMPGKIVRVLVRPGDRVSARQGLVVVEAMKMENELRAAADGRVKAVAVEEGQSVDAGAVLVDIDAVP
jgi:biotin carboxyl carrier protein